MEYGQGSMEGLNITQDFWSNKRVFLTGHTGFKGSWLSLWLQSLGVDLTGYALEAPSEDSLFKIARVESDMNSIIGDICDYESLNKQMKNAEPDIVIHMAAQPLVRYSYLNPIETFSTNVMGTAYMLEAVRNTSSVRAVVNITTDKCYENKDENLSYKEEDPMGGHDPYSGSKGCAELVTSAYRSSFFNLKQIDSKPVALASVRAGNVIGGGDSAKDRLIPDIIRALLNENPLSIRNPNAIRPWQHVLEPLRGYMMLAEKLHEEGAPWAESWNFGPKDQDTKTVSSVVKMLSQLWGVEANWSLEEDKDLHEAKNLRLDISKAQNRLDWKPSLNLESSLKLVVDWYKEKEKGTDMYKYTLKQISNYSQA